MNSSDGMESWVEDLADLEGGESEDSEMDADFGDYADDSEDQDDTDDTDAEGRPRRRRRQPRRRRIRHARPAGYGRGVKGVSNALVRTPSGDAQIALQQPVPSLKEFQQTVGMIAMDARKTSDGMKQLEAQQRQDAAFFNAKVAELKRDIARTRKQAALIGVASALAPVVVRLIQQQTETKTTTTGTSVTT